MMEDQASPQEFAANHPATNLLVVAPPGCGKTELLAMRAQALVPKLGANQRILALTFTNRAKRNLTERLIRVLGGQQYLRYVNVRTFHGHAAEVVLAHGRTIGLQMEGLGMPTTKTLPKALDRFKNHPQVGGVADLLAQLKREPLSDDELLAELGTPGAKLALAIETERIKANQLHFDDLLRHAQRLLQIGEVANLYQQHYGAVLVDEFQDLSLQQLDVAMRTCTASRTFAGDPTQGIYSWAGAAPEKVEAELREICDAVVPLTVSYRSSPAVLAVLNGVTKPLGAEPLRAHEPDKWRDGGAAAALAFSSVQAEAAFIAEASRHLVTTDPELSVGVIARSGWRRGYIDKAFAQMPSVPCRQWDLAVEDPSILTLLTGAVARMPRGVSFAAARQKVIEGLDPSDIDTIEQVGDAFSQLATTGAGSVRAALSRYRPPDDSVAIGPGVHLLNAHIGKGQQFDWVFVPGVEEKHLPDKRSTSGDKLAEEYRVLLVMLSRARHGIVLTRSKTREGPRGSYEIARSRWWDDLAATVTMDAEALRRHLNRLN